MTTPPAQLAAWVNTWREADDALKKVKHEELRHFDHGKNMVLMAMHTTVRQQAHQMQSLTRPGSNRKSLGKSPIINQRAISYRPADPG